MTDVDKEQERKNGLVPRSITTNSSTSTYNERFTSFTSPLPTSISESESITGTTSSTTNNQQHPTNVPDCTNTNTSNITPSIQYNFSSGYSATVLDRIVSKQDLQSSRSRGIENKKNADLLEVRISRMSRKSAAQLALVGQTHTLGKTLFERVALDYAQIKQEKDRIKTKKELAYRTICIAADEVFKKNATKKDYSLWSINDLRTVVKPVKVAEDGKLPTKKKEMLKLWNTIKHRVRAPFNETITPIVNVEDDADMPSNDASLTGL
jgi:hypothetical protein